MPRLYTTTPYTERFFKYIGRKTPTGCIPWTGATTKGYGVIGRGRAGLGNIYATRVAYEIAYGTFSDQLNVCHHCDNPLCVNPSHLFLGTQAENMKDMTVKGRRAIGDMLPQTRLDEEKVALIKLNIIAGITHPEIANRYGISQSAVSLIALGKRWRHVQVVTNLRRI